MSEARILKCKDCGQDFEFSKGEQEFYTEKGFQDPVRCPACRKAKKANNNKNNQP